MKLCRVCQTVKEANEFYPGRRVCISCHKAQVKARELTIDRRGYFRDRSQSEHYKQTTKTWLETTPKGRARKADWRKRQHERDRMIAHMPGHLTPKQRKQYKLEHPYCMRCGDLLEYKDRTIDHIVPLSMGGMDNTGNIQLLCRPCNSRKGQSIADYRPIAVEIPLLSKVDHE